MMPTPNPSNNRPIYRNEASCKTDIDRWQASILCFQKQQWVKINSGNMYLLSTFAKEIASQPMIFGIAAIINDCNHLAKPSD